MKVTAFHGSDFLFDFPDRDKAQHNRVNHTQRHANGWWGLWCTLREDLALQHPFGTYMYQFDIECHDFFVLHTRIEKIHKYSRDPEATYNRWIDNEAKVVCISEDGFHKGLTQAIVLDYSVIRNWRLYSK